jgi:hypothetical protein
VGKAARAMMKVGRKDLLVLDAAMKRRRVVGGEPGLSVDKSGKKWTKVEESC